MAAWFQSDGSDLRRAASPAGAQGWLPHRLSRASIERMACEEKEPLSLQALPEAGPEKNRPSHQVLEGVLAKHSAVVLERLERLDAWLETLDGLLQQPGACTSLQRQEQRPEISMDESQDAPRVSSKPQLSRMDSLGEREARRMGHRMNEEFAEQDKASLDEEPEGPPGMCPALSRWSARILNSQCANVFFGLVVVSNSLYLGVQLEVNAVNRAYGENSSLFMTVHVIYAVLFTAEVCLHVAAEGLRHYLCGEDWSWNWLDCFVVTSSWVELVVDLLSPGDTTSRANSNLRALRLLRVGRLFRVVRIIRVVKFFRSLRTLVYSLVGTLRSLFWALLLLFLIIYIFGILFTDAVLDHIIEQQTAGADLEKQELADVATYFGTLYQSCLTLFKCISDGLTWNEPSTALTRIPLGDFWAQLFHFYIAFCSFAVLNVMTGVFCNSAIKAAESDHEMVVQSLVQTRQELRDQVSSVFHQRLGQVFFVFADECEFQSCATVSANKLVFENTVCTLVCDRVAHVDQP
ncbi:unnamed protein product [Effrenium voratum]|nr:unnamed protein product [Effrenium voratum]